MPCRTLVGLGIACVLALPSVAACTSAHTDTPSSSGRSSRPSEPGSTKGTSGTGSAPPSVQKPPELDKGETLAGRRNATTGSATLPFGKGTKHDALIVAVRCQGAGRIKVAVRSVRVAFPLNCVADQVSTTYNEVAVAGVDRGGVVSVEAPPGVRWSMTIGRGPAAHEDASGAGSGSV
ncbi:hypothetical protein [Streptomyces aureus]